MTVEITDENFESFTLNNSKSYILDFWAPRCGPCKTLSPFFEELSKQYKEEVVIGKVDVDSNLKLASEFGIRSIPTILYIRNGEIVDKQVGATSKKVLEDKLKLNLLFQ